MPEISLATLSLILGAVALLKGVLGFMGGEKARDFINGFPRNNTAGYVLILAAMVWFLLILKDENMADFENLRTPFYVFILLTGIGSCLYLKDFLAVRGTAVLMLLLAKLIVDTARFHESEWRLVLVTAAYLMVIGGMWFTVSPWRMRDLFAWGTADEKLFKILCGVRIGFGVLLLALGFFEFK
jgi:hypothetical protein